jgi:hypothetical protein
MIGKILPLLGNFPLMNPFDAAMKKNPIIGPAKRLLARNIPLPKGMQDMMGSLMSGGIGSMLQNPMGAVMGQLQGQLGGMMGQLTGALGGAAGPLTGALNGVLGGSLGQLQSMTGMMSGLSIPNMMSGQFGLQDIAGHLNVASMLGSALPANLGIDKVLGPLNMAADITGMVSDLGSMAQGVIAGQISIPDAVLEVTQMAAHIDNVMFDATAAINGLQEFNTQVAAVSQVANLLTGGDGPERVFAQAILQPAAAAQLQATFDSIAPAPQ